MQELMGLNKGTGNHEGICFWAGSLGLVYHFKEQTRCNLGLKAHRQESIQVNKKASSQTDVKKKESPYLLSLKAKPFLIKYLETSTRSPFSFLQKIFTGNGHVVLFS